MTTLLGSITHALRCRRGAAMVEYAVLAALIAAVMVTSLTSMSTGIRTKFTTIVSYL